MSVDSPKDKKSVSINPKRMIAARMDSGLSHKQLAKLAKVSDDLISRMEKGESVWIANAKRVADALNVTVDYLKTLGPPKTTNDKHSSDVMVEAKGNRISVHLTLDHKTTKAQLERKCKKAAHALYAAALLTDGFDDDDLDPRISSISFTMRLTPRDAKKFMNAFFDGKLEQFNIVSIALSDFSDAFNASVTPEQESETQRLQTSFIAEALDLHKKWLNGSKKGKTFYYPDADLIRANLTGADLTRAVLIDTDLTYADLTGAKLTDAVLTRAVLTDANLTDADLKDAVLIRVNLHRAVLTRVNLHRADLTRAGLRGAVLRGAVLTEANLTNADFTRADLTNADLTGAILDDAIFADANLTNVIWGDDNRHFAQTLIHT